MGSPSVGLGLPSDWKSDYFFLPVFFLAGAFFAFFLAAITLTSDQFSWMVVVAVRA
jgi:hypothetical protein